MFCCHNLDRAFVCKVGKHQLALFCKQHQSVALCLLRVHPESAFIRVNHINSIFVNGSAICLTFCLANIICIHMYSLGINVLRHTFSVWIQQMNTDISCASTMARQSYSVWISIKILYIPVNPFNCLYLVNQSQVSR